MQTVKLIGSSPLVTNCAYSCSFFNVNSIYAQSLRWKRKPIWLPTAKTKVFRVHPRPQIPHDEAEEIKRLYNNYRTYMRSIRKYFHAVNKENEVQLDESVINKAEEDDFKKCLEINEQWNKQILQKRIIRLEQENQERLNQIMEALESKKKRDESIRLQADEMVKKAKEIAPTFITSENIDQAINEALENIVDHNRALNKDGTWCPKQLESSEAEDIKINQ